MYYNVCFSVNSSTVNSFIRNILVLLFFLCVNNKLWLLWIIFEVVRIITFLLEIYRHVYSCVWYRHNYQWSDFVCRVTEKICLKPSVITSLPKIYRHVCNCVSCIHTYQYFLFIGCLRKSIFEVTAHSMMYDSTSEFKGKYG